MVKQVCILGLIQGIAWLSLMQILQLSCVSGKEFPTLDHIQTKTDPAVQRKAAQDLIQRLIQGRSQEFAVEIDPSLGPRNRDTFQLQTVNKQLLVRGSSGVAAAWGFHYYLTQYCGGHVSWAGVQITLPLALPIISQRLTVTSNDRFRYYQNVCTVSYSFAWWNWTRWEREIDWMAMHGINLPLAFNGQEAIWQRVYMSLGFSQDELDAHFAGPAFLAWSRMGNIHGWGGPLSSSWHAQQVALQHKILDRMRSLGIVPVLPAFAGHVPLAITKHFPNVSVSRLRDWGHFNESYCCTALLDVTDPLFLKIGRAFITEYTKEFGTDHIYNTDTFNELTPKSSSPAYLYNASRSVYGAMLAGDNQAIWVMQGWLFLETFWGPPQIKALLTGVPQGKMIVLDLYSENAPIYGRTQSYYGQPFIWCMLHNFGGTVAMYGAVDSVNQNPFKGRSFPNSSMVGIGLTPEGINQNNVIYEFMMENSWRTKPRDVMAWSSDYARRRYGQNNLYTSKAWRILMHGVYNGSYHDGETDVFITNQPLITTASHQSGGIYNCTNGYHDNELDIFITTQPQITSPSNQVVWYDIEEFFTAWDLMITAAPSLVTSDLFRYDLVDVSRQALQLISIHYYAQLISAYKNKDLNQVKTAGEKFIELMSDMDILLHSDEHFLLGVWLEDAKSLASSPAETDLFEYNARTQVTTWGPTTEILDYANKQWSGLIEGYYKPRWQLFITQLAESLYQGVPYNQTKYKEDVYMLVEKPFTMDRSNYPNTTKGDQIQIASAIHHKYRPITHINTKFFAKLPKLSAKGRKFAKYATKWLKKYSKRTDRHSESRKNEVKSHLNLKW